MRTLLLMLGVALCAALGLSSVASARARPRSRTTVVVPNGTYGVNGRGGAYIVFVVRDRRVSRLNFNIQVTCQASDAPDSDQRFFGAGARAPQGRVIPRNGRLVLEWQERGDGRYGQINVELKFGVRDLANISVIVPEEPGSSKFKEMCDGVDSLRFLRGYELSAPRY
jgi:hypothetical protein